VSTPDVTKAQLVALVQAILAAAVAFGAPLDGAQQTSLIALAGVLAVTLTWADAHIRRGRQQHLTRRSPSPELLAAIAAAPAERDASIRPVDPIATTLARARESETAAAEADAANGPPPEPGTYPLDTPAEPARPPAF